MDPLEQLPKEKWPQLQDEFKKTWPLGVPGFYLIDTQLEHPDLGKESNFKIFCPFGDVKNGMVALSTKSTINEVIILPTTHDIDKITEALATTKLIDWNKSLLLPFADNIVLRVISNILPSVGITITEQVCTIKHFLPKTSPLYELNAPQGTYMGPLKYENIDQVDRAWPHRHESSTWFFKLLIDNNQTYGLFADDHSLLAWLTICEVGFLTHLYCEEKHRKKGYAEYVAKYVSNELLKQGKDVFCYILEENIKSMKLFRKIGYEVIGRGCWTTVGPTEN